MSLSNLYQQSNTAFPEETFLSADDLLAKIKAAVKPDKTLAFNGTLVGSDTISALLANAFYYSSGNINIAASDVSLNSSNSVITITGNVLYPDLPQPVKGKQYSCTVNIAVWLDKENNVQTTVNLSLPDGWSFPDIFQGLNDSPFNVLQVTGASIIVNSLPYTEPTTNIQFATGTNFKGTLQFKDPIAYLSDLLLNTSNILIYGAVSNAEKHYLSFQTKPCNGMLVKTPLSNVTLNLSMVALPAQGDLSPVAAALTLNGNFQLGSGANQTGSFSMEVIPNTSTLLLDVEFKQLTLTDFVLLTPFTGSSDNPFNLLPAPVEQALADAGNAFLLNALSLSFDYKNIQFISAGVNISTNIPNGLTPFADIPQIKITALDFNWKFTKNEVNFLAQTGIAISNYKVLIGFQTEFNKGFTISVSQDPTTPLNVSDLITTLIPDLKGTVPELDVESFSLILSPVQNQYFLDIYIKSDWALPGFSNLSLSNVSINGAYYKALNPALSANINSTFTLVIDKNDPTQNVNILIGAQTNTNNNGWTFSGQSGKDQVIPIGNLITALVNQFNVSADVPDCLAALTVQNIGVSFNTNNKQFQFTCELDFPIDGQPIKMLLSIDLTPNGEKKFSGILYIDQFQFTLIFDSNKGSNAFVAAYSVWEGAPPSISIKELVNGISPQIANSIPDLEIQLKSVKFVYLSENNKSTFAFALDLGTHFSLSEIPLIGNKLPENANISLNDLQVLYCSAPLTAAQIGNINKLLASAKVSELVSGKNLPQGVQISGTLELLGMQQVLSIGTGSESSTQSSSNTASRTSFTGTLSDSQSAAPSITWFNIQQQLGPVQFQNIGVSFQNSILSFAINASITVGPFTLAMQGLTFGSGLKEFSPVFDLSGLGIGYSSPPLTVEGAILKVKPDDASIEFQFDGALLVQAADWGLSAIASYAQYKNGTPSMFVFVDVNAVLGGPPYFIVEGLMGGFGFNRNLTIPSFDQVAKFPLLALSSPPSGGSVSDQAMQVINELEGGGKDKIKWIAPSVGDYWLAAGIKFSSFEILTGEVLLVAQFGNDLQFALLGLAWLSLPQNATAENSFVFVELQMEAVIKPTEGFFSVAASLTPNSFVLTKDCHLTGGFAFDLWFGNNVNAGQFVMTVGGYHPAFVVPAYYPKVARLGFNWQVTSDISIKGESYFAITPTCGMAGGSLQALYQSGDIKAWFVAEANMLVTWNPFSFLAQISIDLGASVRLNLLVCHKTITVSIGASLTLWGPPLGGIVKVHIVVVTVSIQFGSDNAQDKNYLALSWSPSTNNGISLDGFNSLLPKNTDVCKAVANAGLSSTLNIDNKGNIIFNDQPLPADAKKLWVVRAGKFSFTSQSAVPSTSFVTGAGKQNLSAVQDAPLISIRPMNLKGNVKSTHHVKITKNGVDVNISDWKVSPVTGSLAATLWGDPLSNSKNQFIQAPQQPSHLPVDGLITGYTIQSPSPLLGYTFGNVPMERLEEEIIIEANSPLNVNPASTNAYTAAPATDTIADIKNIATTPVANRNALYTVLSNTNLCNSKNDNMIGLSLQAGVLYSAEPMEVVQS